MSARGQPTAPSCGGLAFDGAVRGPGALDLERDSLRGRASLAANAQHVPSLAATRPAIGAPGNSSENAAPMSVGSMTRNLFAALLFLFLATDALADYNSGYVAFDRGDFATARKEWKPLAEKGDARAQFRLGCLYTFGQGVPEDYAMALRFYRMAAERGDRDAQNNLGGMYAEGLGVQADLVQAYMWFDLAAAQGRELASKNRAFIAKSMTPKQIAEAQSLARDRRAQHH